MNKGIQVKLLKLDGICRDTLKGTRQSVNIWRGDMWAIIAAVHELQKLGKLPLPDPPTAHGWHAEKETP